MIDLKELVIYTKKMNLLYVEDDAIVRITTMELLENMFENIVVATDGEDALELYRMEYQNVKKYFDIVITDISMPNLNGYDMSKEILLINPNQKIIAMTAYEDKAKVELLLDMGIVDIIKKPISFNEVIKAFNKIVTIL